MCEEMFLKGGSEKTPSPDPSSAQSLSSLPATCSEVALYTLHLHPHQVSLHHSIFTHLESPAVLVSTRRTCIRRVPVATREDVGSTRLSELVPMTWQVLWLFHRRGPLVYLDGGNIQLRRVSIRTRAADAVNIEQALEECLVVDRSEWRRDERGVGRLGVSG
jgi:hypothetical protein